MQTEKEAPGSVSLNPPRSFWYSVACAAIYMIVFGSWVILKGNTSPLSQALQSSGEIVGIILSFALSWIGIKRYRLRDRTSPPHSLERRLRLWLPLTLSFALLLQIIGDSLYAYYASQHLIAFPVWADVVVLVTYPFFILTILLFPTHTLSRQARLRVLLDSLLIVVALLTLSWYFVLGPTLLPLLQGTSIAPLIVLDHTALPLFDLLLVSCLILFTTYIPRALRLSVILVSVGLAFFVQADISYQYQFLHAHFTLGWGNLGWSIGDFLFALSAQTLRWLPDIGLTSEGKVRHPSSITPIPLWRVQVPYVFVPVSIGLVLYVWNVDRANTLALGTYSCGLLLLGLIFIRQILAVRETHRLNGHLQLANTRLETLATTDPLTELPNHRALLSTLTAELERAQRYQRSCTLLFFDLDHFKALNDGYGHAAGDDVLIAFGRRLSQSVRSIDTVGRWGGEEFIAILPETTMEEAEAIAERIRSSVSQQPFALAGGIHLTCSIGIAHYPTHVSELDGLINAADQAMYAAKKLGRNQYRVIDDPMVQLILADDTGEGGREEEVLKGILAAFTSLLYRRDKALAEHSNAVADLVELLAMRTGSTSNEVHMFRLAGQLHDLGKISIPDAILQKPAALTESEWRLVKQHSSVGAEIISHIPALRPLAPVIHAHHEHWDGTGYPEQLRGEAIPLAARLISVANAYTAMLADRPHQLARSSEEALSELRRGAGTQFDPLIVEMLATLLSERAHKLVTVS